MRLPRAASSTPGRIMPAPPSATLDFSFGELAPPPMAFRLLTSARAEVRSRNAIGGGASSPKEKSSVADGGAGMIRPGVLLAARGSLIFLWHACGEAAGVFCYRMGMGARMELSTRGLVQVPSSPRIHLSRARHQSHCL